MFWSEQNSDHAPFRAYNMSSTAYQNYKREQEEKERFKQKAKIFVWIFFSGSLGLFLFSVGKAILVYGGM